MTQPGPGHPRFAPAGRRDPLSVLPLRLPRAWRGPGAPWDLRRGFRLRVVDSNLVILTLGAPGGTAPGHALNLQPAPGEEALLVLVAPTGRAPEALDLARRLPQEEGWRPACMLILGDRGQIPSYGTARKDLRRALRGVDFPVAWVLDDMPTTDFRGLPYFTVERSLRQLERVGRRLARWARYRRLLPW